MMDWPIAISTMCITLVSGVVVCVALVAGSAAKSKDDSGAREN
jgi:hypothetical protein